MNDPKSLRALVQTAMDAILVEHDREKVRRHFHPSFVQHNPWAEDGGAHVEAMCDFTFGVEMSRWAVQGDIVAYHGLYTAPNPLGDHPLLCVDLWRVQGDQIVEHWDALQPMPQADANASLAGGGDGFATVSAEHVARNAATARRLVEAGIRNADSTVFDEVFSPHFVLHRPGLDPADSREGFEDWVNHAKPAVEVKRSVSSGDLVFLQLLVEAGGTEQIVYDIFRFDAEGRIAEQWMVAQPRVPLAEAANPHPHF